MAKTIVLRNYTKVPAEQDALILYLLKRIDRFIKNGFFRFGYESAPDNTQKWVFHLRIREDCSTPQYFARIYPEFPDRIFLDEEKYIPEVRKLVRGYKGAGTVIIEIKDSPQKM